MNKDMNVKRKPHRVAVKQRWVIKIGSALLTNDGQGLDTRYMALWAAQIAALMQQGIEVVLVSSGAVAAGMTRLGWTRRPVAMSELQAAAAVGQSGLVQAWEAAFNAQAITIGQILLDNDDLSNRQRYLNARSTINTLLAHRVLPVINENDTVVTDEIRFGDNDTLAGLVANLVNADLLVLLTDQLGLYDADPRHNAAAKLIQTASANDDSLLNFAGASGGGLGRGGMQTKVKAARLAGRSGTDTVIASGRTENVLVDLMSGASVGTRLHADQAPVIARKQWLAGQLKAKGELRLDDGAVKSLREHGRSLLAVGVVATSGQYQRGDLVRCVAASNGAEVARGLVNYASQEVALIQGQSSDKYLKLLGFAGDDELIHRDNLALID